MNKWGVSSRVLEDGNRCWFVREPGWPFVTWFLTWREAWNFAQREARRTT